MASHRPDIGKKALGNARNEPHREPLGTISGNRQVYNISHEQPDKPLRRVLAPTSKNVPTNKAAVSAHRVNKIPPPIKFIYPWSKVDVDAHTRGTGTQVLGYKRDYPKRRASKQQLLRTASARIPKAPVVPIVEERPRVVRKNKNRTAKRPINPESAVWGRG